MSIQNFQPQVQLLNRQPLYIKPQDDSLKAFAAWLVMQDRRQGTIKGHLKRLRLILKHIKTWDIEEVESFLAEFKLKGRANSYINTLMDTISVYARYKQLNPRLLHLDRFKINPTIKATFSEKEIMAFLSIPCLSGWHKEKHQMYQVFWHICAFSGMRPGEVAALTVDDVDFGRNVFVIRQSKTNTPGVVPISPNIKPLLEDYIKKISGVYLFSNGKKSLNGKVIISDGDWEEDFRKRINLLGIKRVRLTPYSFRHSMATSLLASGASLFHVKKLLRHSSLQTTEIYSHLTTQDVEKALSKHPLMKMVDPRSALGDLVDYVKGMGLENDPRYSFSINESENSIKVEISIKK